MLFSIYGGRVRTGDNVNTLYMHECVDCVWEIDSRICSKCDFKIATYLLMPLWHVHLNIFYIVHDHTYECEMV